ncbi:MAG: tyrosine-type recombinase/integrase [Candidatus Rokuibacteriota bacterium]
MFPISASPELALLLQTQRARTEAWERTLGQVIPHDFHRQGKPVRSFRRSWVSACRSAGLAGKIPHDFRRTAVRNLERAGVPRSVAMKLVGHKTESVYRRYAIVAERDLRAGVEKLAALHADDAREVPVGARREPGK